MNAYYTCSHGPISRSMPVAECCLSGLDLGWTVSRQDARPSSMLLHVHRKSTDYYGRGAQDGHLDFHTVQVLSLAGVAKSIIFLSRQIRDCRDKTRLLSGQKYVCRDKHIFVATNVILSRQKWYLWQLPPTMKFSVASRPPRTYGLFGTRTPGRPPRLYTAPEL